MVMVRFDTVTVLTKYKFAKSIRSVSRRKRVIGIIIHKVFESFEKKLYNYLKGLIGEKIEVKNFRKIIWKIREEIVGKFSNSRYLQEISTFIYSLIKNLRKILNYSLNQDQFSATDILLTYFGGTPEFEKRIQFNVNGSRIAGIADQLIQSPNGTIIIKDMKPEIRPPFEIDKNPSVYQMSIYAVLSELFYSKTCEKLVLIDYNFNVQEINFNNDLRCYILKEIEGLANKMDAGTTISQNELKPGRLFNININRNLSSSNVYKDVKPISPEIPSSEPETPLNINDFDPLLMSNKSSLKNNSNLETLFSEISNKIEKDGVKMEIHEDIQNNEEENVINDSESEKIGWCIARRTKKPKISLETPSRIEGYIEDHQKVKIIPGLHVVVDYSGVQENLIPLDMRNVRVISKIIQVKPYTDSIALIKNSTSENINEVELQPLYEISEDDGYKGQVRPHLFDKATIRFCSNPELIDLLRIPTTGFELGEIEDFGERNIKYKLPYHKLAESTCILGTQGTGKTTLIYGMVTKLVGDINRSKIERPSVVVLDIESEYQNFGTDNFRICNEGFIRNYGIDNDLETRFYKIGQGDTEYTLDFFLLDPEDYIYFIPDLTTKSAEAFISIATRVREALIKNGAFSKDNLLSGIKSFVKSCPPSEIHLSTAQALMRGCAAKNFELFDRPSAKKLPIQDFMKPGKLSIINLFDLSDQEQRIVSLYLIMIFYRLKMKAKDKKDEILQLVVDEAHRIFPRFATISSEKEYIDRILSKISEITHRGRKRNYGIIFATQSPRDLRKELITMCNTKILFRIVGETLFLNEILGKRYLNEMKSLPVGTGIVTCQGIHEPLKVRFPFLQIKDF